MLLHGGDPNWVGEQCTDGEQFSAKKCEVLVDNAGTCPVPSASAYDHHEGLLDDRITIEKKMYVRSLARTKPEKVDVIVSDINYNIRGEYIIDFDVMDLSGNDAQTVHFGMRMVDTVAPTFDNLPSSLTIQAMENWMHFYELDAVTASDTYDQDVSDTVAFSITLPDGTLQSGSQTIDTKVLGGHSITYTAKDFASIFGANNADNVATHILTANVVHAVPPEIFCKVPSTVFTEDVSSCSVSEGVVT